MNYFYSVFLGVLQGITEFLPVSSSGHLVLAQSVIPGFSQPGVLFDVFLHFGTLFAVLVFFRKEILKLSFKYLFFIAVGTIPAIAVGLFLNSSVEMLFENVRLVGFALIVTGMLNFITSKTKGNDRNLSGKKSFLIGLMQAFAIIPGISRSGSTIFAGVKLGLSPKKAALFSFLLSVPAVLGANILEIFSSLGEKIDYGIYLSGFFAAFISGLFAIGLVIRLLEEKKFRVFSFYCIFVGVLVLLF